MPKTIQLTQNTVGGNNQQKIDTINRKRELDSSECKLTQLLGCQPTVTLDLMTQVAESPDPSLVNNYQVVSESYQEIQPPF